MRSSFKFRTIAISKTQILLRTHCPKFSSCLNCKLRVNWEYTMLTLILTATVDQLKWIASTRRLGHGGIHFSGFSVMACSRAQTQSYKKLYFSGISIPNEAWKSFSFFFYLIRIRTYLLFLLFRKHLLNGKGNSILIRIFFNYFQYFLWKNLEKI